MISDTERRKVAARLRELCDYCDENEVSLCDDDWPGVLSDYIWPEDSGYHTYDEDCRRLADLIEPSEPEVRCVAEVKVDGERLEELVHDAAVELTGIDRDELLEEVKELEKCAYYFGLDFDEDEPLRDRLKEASEAFAESARRIREACGEVVA